MNNIEHKQANKTLEEVVSSLASDIETLREELEDTKKISGFYLSQIQEKDKQINALLKIVASYKKQGQTEIEASNGPSEEDVREAMHTARQRIEGNDYKEHTDSEPYKKYHRALTEQFKSISASLGSDRPSALPPEQRGSFIKACNKLRVLDDGTIGQ